MKLTRIYRLDIRTGEKRNGLSKIAEEVPSNSHLLFLNFTQFLSVILTWKHKTYKDLN